MNVNAVISHINMTKNWLVQANKHCTIMVMPYKGFKAMCAYQANIAVDTIDTQLEVHTALIEAYEEFCREVKS